MTIKRSDLDRKLQNAMKYSCFIDGLQNQVCIRIKAVSDITEYIDILEIPDTIDHPINTIANLFSKN